MRGSDDPYARIAALYDVEFADAVADLGWYARNVDRGDTLVLGCGTGRVAATLPGRVTGLDRSEPMIAHARAVHGDSVRWVVGDMRSFDLGSFDQIVIPNASFSFLPTRADQAACLSACAAALRPGGRLIVDVPMPDAAWLHQPHTPERPAWDGIVDGRRARRTREVRRYPVAQRLELTDRYFVDDEFLATSVLVLRQIWPGEVEWMIEAAGMYVERLLGDYADRPLHEGCPRLLTVAIKP